MPSLPDWPFAGATSHYQQMLNRQPGFVEAMVYACRPRPSCTRRSLCRRDRNLAKPAAQRAPGDSMLLFHLATAKYEAGDISQAIILLQKAAQQPGAAPEVFNSLGAMLAEVGRNSEAIMPRFARRCRCDRIIRRCATSAMPCAEAGQESEAAELTERRVAPSAPVLAAGIGQPLGNLPAAARWQSWANAVATYRRAPSPARQAMQHLPDNLGVALCGKSWISPARSNRIGLALLHSPDSAETHYALAWSLAAVEGRVRSRIQRSSRVAAAAMKRQAQQRDHFAALRMVAKPKIKRSSSSRNRVSATRFSFFGICRLIGKSTRRMIVAVQPELLSLVIDLGIEAVGLGMPMPAQDLSFPSDEFRKFSSSCWG